MRELSITYVFKTKSVVSTLHCIRLKYESFEPRPSGSVTDKDL